MITEHVFGFHGTTRDKAHEILSGLTWTLSRNDYDWLGHGVYLFQDSPLHALRFAEKRADKNKSEGASGSATEPFVIRTKLRLSNSIDLTDSYWAPAVKVAFHRFYLKRAESGLEVPTQRPFNPRTDTSSRIHVTPGRHRGPMRDATKHLLDCAVMNFFINEFPTGARPHSIRAAFLDGNPLYESSWLYDLAHVQICVLEPNLVITAPEEVPIGDLIGLRNSGNSVATNSAGRPSA